MIDIRAKFDKEYRTQYKGEVEFLRSSGIRYTFVKDVEGISTYKYSKTSELFYALAVFYERLDRGGPDSGETCKH